MSILSIDYGDKKVGLAKSGHDGKIAVPLAILKNKGTAALISELKNICQKEEISKIIVGVPLSLKTKNATCFLRQADLKNKQMKKVLKFINALKNNFKTPVIMEDERLSTKMAQKLKKGVKNSGQDDAIAAMLILQNYLDKYNH